MCGIVLAGGSSLYKKDIECFEKLIFGDTFRGPHSTGVYTRRTVKGTWCPTLKRTKDDQTFHPLFKDSVDGPDFLKTRGWELLRDGIGTTPNYGNFYVGHNRWRTVGAINKENAHPFRHGKITMVHNGTLIDQSLLPESDNFEVDSENVAYSLDVWGVDKTIQNLHGAFTLVWHNVETETLHIIRNEERPFHLAEVEGITTASDTKWFGASEEDMLMWILRRNKVPYKIKRHFEIEIGIEYIFDVSNDKFSFKEERKHDLPEFHFTYNNYYPNWYQKQFSKSASNEVSGSKLSDAYSSKSHKNTPDELLEQHGLTERMGSILKFCSLEWSCYDTSKDENKGRVLGMCANTSDYIEVQCHNVTKDIFKEGDYLYGKIVGAYVKNYMLTIICTEGMSENPAVGWDLSDQENTIKCSSCGGKITGKSYTRMSDSGEALVCMNCFCDDTPFTDNKKICEGCKKEVDAPILKYKKGEPKYYCAECDNKGEVDTKEVGGTLYTQAEWEKASKCCGNCSSPISFEAADSVYIYNGEPICKGCQDYILSEHADQVHAATIIGSDGLGSFVCRTCGETHSIADESELENICEACYKYLHLNSEENPTYISSNLAEELEETMPWEDHSLDATEVHSETSTCEFCGDQVTGSLHLREVDGVTYNACVLCCAYDSENVRSLKEEKRKEAAVARVNQSESICECCGAKTKGRYKTRIEGSLRNVCSECFHAPFDLLEEIWADKHRTNPTQLKSLPIENNCEFCGESLKSSWNLRTLGETTHRACGKCDIQDNVTLKDMLLKLKEKKTENPEKKEEVNEDHSLTKVLRNGMRVTKGLFFKMNTCRCGVRISWKYADKAAFQGDNILCPSCDRKSG